MAQKKKSSEKLQKSGSRSVYLSERDMQILRQSGGPDMGLSQRISDIILRYSAMMEEPIKTVRSRFSRSELLCLAIIARETHIDSAQLNSALPHLILNETTLCEKFDVDPIILSDTVAELTFQHKAALLELADTDAYYKEGMRVVDAEESEEKDYDHEHTQGE